MWNGAHRTPKLPPVNCRRGRDPRDFDYHPWHAAAAGNFANNFTGKITVALDWKAPVSDAEYQAQSR